MKVDIVDGAKVLPSQVVTLVRVLVFSQLHQIFINQSLGSRGRPSSDYSQCSSIGWSPGFSSKMDVIKLCVNFCVKGH